MPEGDSRPAGPPKGAAPKAGRADDGRVEELATLTNVVTTMGAKIDRQNLLGGMVVGHTAQNVESLLHFDANMFHSGRGLL